MAQALQAQERHDYQRLLREMELAQLEDLMRGPALSVTSENLQSATYAETSSVVDSDSKEQLPDGSSCVQNQQQPMQLSNDGKASNCELEKFSFSTVTQVCY